MTSKCFNTYYWLDISYKNILKDNSTKLLNVKGQKNVSNCIKQSNVLSANHIVVHLKFCFSN